MSVPSPFPRRSDDDDQEIIDFTYFERAVAKVVRGTARIETMATVLVRGAVRELLRRIAEDYALDESQLRATYETEIIAPYVSHPRPPREQQGPNTENTENTPQDVQFCSGKTGRAKRPCRRVVANGAKYCHAHAEQELENEDRRRRVDSYRTVLRDMLPPSQLPPSQLPASQHMPFSQLPLSQLPVSQYRPGC